LQPLPNNFFFGALQPLPNNYFYGPGHCNGFPYLSRYGINVLYLLGMYCCLESYVNEKGNLLELLGLLLQVVFN
jgi:hypothetical protein